MITPLDQLSGKMPESNKALTKKGIDHTKNRHTKTGILPYISNNNPIMKHIYRISEYCVYCSIGTQYFYVRSIQALSFFL